jgi:alkylated DNA repair dioxygenase AlkB
VLLPGIINPESGNLLPQDGSLIYVPDFLRKIEADHSFQALKEKVNWRNDKIKMYGKEHFLPRLTAWYADPPMVYTYSKITMHPDPWLPEMLDLKNRIEKHTNETFNSLLLNYYRSGQDHVSWHADNEPELGRNSLIASLSLGGVRRFQLKHRYNASLPSVTLELESGSLVLMSDEIQDFWLHRITQTKKSVDPRINLTFRTIL